MTPREILEMFGQATTEPPASPPMSREAFLGRLYALSDGRQPLLVCDHIMSFFDGCLAGGHFGICDAILGAVDVDRLDSQGLHTLAVCGAWGRGRLPAWPDYVARARAAMLARYGPEKTAKLMDRWLPTGGATP